LTIRGSGWPLRFKQAVQLMLKTRPDDFGSWERKAGEPESARLPKQPPPARPDRCPTQNIVQKPRARWSWLAALAAVQPRSASGRSVDTTSRTGWQEQRYRNRQLGPQV